MTEERDIVEQLRAVCNCNIATAPCGMEEECRLDFEAADEITRLRAELAAAREAAVKAGALLDHARLFRGYVSGPLHEPWADYVTRLCDDERMKGILNAD